MGQMVLTVVMENLFNVIASILSIWVAYYVIPYISTSLIPFLREKRLYNIVAIGVQAAEKMANSDQIRKADKKEYVLMFLRKKGIPITKEVETFIESVCQQLDTVGQATYEAFKKEEQGKIDMKPVTETAEG